MRSGLHERTGMPVQDVSIVSAFVQGLLRSHGLQPSPEQQQQQQQQQQDPRAPSFGVPASGQQPLMARALPSMAASRRTVPPAPIAAFRHGRVSRRVFIGDGDFLVEVWLKGSLVEVWL